MRFFTNETSIKRDAKRLNKWLARFGHELRHTQCLDLTARLHGFAHFSEWQNTIWDGPLSPFDDVDDEIVEARYQHQERVMAEAGSADIGGAVRDLVNPTGWRKRPLRSNGEVADGAIAVARVD